MIRRQQLSLPNTRIHLNAFAFTGQELVPLCLPRSEALSECVAFEAIFATLGAIFGATS